MADLQSQFEKFHEDIRVDYDMSEDLREKRDIVVGKLNKHLADNNRPTFQVLLQGSYKMKTGVKPLDGKDYDIDIGLRFPLSESEHSATDVRSWVLDAVANHTKNVYNKAPCIRVAYSAGYHLDLVTYAVWEDSFGVKHCRLAHRDNGWRPADPPSLLAHVNDYRAAFVGTEDSKTKTDQFRRCVRYLRRWNDVQASNGGQRRLPGIAIVLLTIQYGLNKTTFLDERPDDRRALQNLVSRIRTTSGTLSAIKPTPEYENLLDGLDSTDMANLQDGFATLYSALEEAGSMTDPVEAAKLLADLLGSDFTIPSAGETAKRTAAPAIITSSSSA